VKQLWKAGARLADGLVVSIIHRASCAEDKVFALQTLSQVTTPPKLAVRVVGFVLFPNMLRYTVADMVNALVRVSWVR
jgi:hypothetical protein